MGIENLTEFQIFRGIYYVLTFSIFLIIGIKITLKYIHYRRREILLQGFAMIFLGLGWLGNVLFFLLFIFFNYIAEQPFLLYLNTPFWSIAILLWMYLIGYMIYPNIKKILVGIYAIFFIVYNFFFFILIFTDPEFVVFIEKPCFINAGPYHIFFFIVAGASAYLGCFLFAKNAMKSDDPIIRLKGIFLFSAFFSLATGGTMEAVSGLNLILFIISRLLIIYSAFAYYFGFFLPKRLENRLIKKHKKL